MKKETCTAVLYSKLRTITHKHKLHVILRNYHVHLEFESQLPTGIHSIQLTLPLSGQLNRI
jgi:hypothetical protein